MKYDIRVGIEFLWGWASYKIKKNFSEKNIASYKYITLFAQPVSCCVRYKEFAHGKSSLPGN